MDIADIRPVEIHKHPVARRRYLIPTQCICLLYANIVKLIKRRDPGLMIFGNPRYGKTSSIRYCIKALGLDYPGLPIGLMSALKVVVPTEGHFFTTFLEVVGHKDHKTGTIADKRIRLIRHLKEKAQRNDLDMYILFIDEAQKFTELQYEWLRDVYDQLELQGIVLLVILVGQLDLVRQKLNFKAAKKVQIVSRFMITELPFKGITSKEDFLGCLESYDRFVFPSGSDWTFTRFFFPLAYSNGFRLATYVDILWEAFNEYHNKLQLKSNIEIPMKYFTKAMEILFVDYCDGDHADFILDTRLCEEIINESWFYSAQDDLKKMDILE